jgi:hypothetical protein
MSDNDDTITITPETRAQAASTALELIELARDANATGIVDTSIVTAEKSREVTLGLLCLLTCAFNAVGNGHFNLGLSRTRELVKGVITMQMQAEAGDDD